MISKNNENENIKNKKEKLMKLLDLNIGIKLDNNQKVIDLIKKEQYDIVALQESMRKIEDTVLDRYDSSNRIKEQTNLQYDFFGALWFADHHEKNKVMRRDFGGLTEQGNELLTNYPIIQVENVFYYKKYANFSDTTNFKKEDHPRAFIDAIIDVNGKKLQIINVHGIWNEEKKGDKRTLLQAESILSHVRYDIPSIIVGDFNLLPHTKSIELISEKMINLIEKYNIQSTRPLFDDGLDTGNVVCDYIFINSKVKEKSFNVIKNTVSDHFPLVLEFEI